MGSVEIVNTQEKLYGRTQTYHRIKAERFFFKRRTVRLAINQLNLAVT